MRFKEKGFLHIKFCIVYIDNKKTMGNVTSLKFDDQEMDEEDMHIRYYSDNDYKTVQHTILSSYLNIFLFIIIWLHW